MPHLLSNSTIGLTRGEEITAAAWNANAEAAVVGMVVGEGLTADVIDGVVHLSLDRSMLPYSDDSASGGGGGDGEYQSGTFTGDAWIDVQQSGSGAHFTHVGPSSSASTMTIEGTSGLTGSADLSFDAKGHYTGGDGTVTIEHDSPGTTSSTVTIQTDAGSDDLTFDGKGHYNGGSKTIDLTVGGLAIPACPETDGVYFLKATVASGVCTLSWVAAEECPT
jgi:hypothetical protein